MVAKLSGQDRKDALAGVKDWKEIEGRDAIGKTFTFADFTEAFGFMARVAQVADAADHHPEWKNIYKTVEVVLSTHDAGGVTSKDIELAKAMDKIASEQS